MVLRSVPEITTIFFDVGGVLLTNGWDRGARRSAVDHFGLDWEEFQDRHDFVADAFETGEMLRTDYLNRTVFYRDRDFTRDEFVAFMERQSQSLPGLDLAAALADEYWLATLNNESRELNDYRIATFGLRDHFRLFLSSCYVGVKKPEARIYELALEITQKEPGECVFVDDRDLNLECAASAGMTGIHFTGVEELRRELAGLGVTA